jgi:RNA polymerase primary sigma factor
MILNTNEERAIIERAKNGDNEYQEQLLTNNLGLLYKYTKKYNHKYVDDIFQEAAIGFLHATKKYEFERDTKFSTYATFWIMQAANRGYQKLVRDVKLPSNILENVQKIKKAITFYMTENHCEPDIQELTKITGIHSSKIEYYKMFASTSSSLDFIVDDNENSLGDYIEDTSIRRFEETIDEEELEKILYNALDILSEREKFIVERFFGLKGLQTMNLSEMGELLQLSRERIRQIKDKALSKMKNHSKELLEVYL